MAGFELNPNLAQELTEEVRPAIMEAAEAIADGVDVTFPGARSGPAQVTETAEGAQVGLAGPFGAIEEWGSVNSGPMAPLRTSVYASGLRFEEI